MPPDIQLPQEPKSLFEIDQQVQREKQNKPSGGAMQASRVETQQPLERETAARNLIRPALNLADEYNQEAEEHPGGVKGFLYDLADNLKVGREKMGAAMRSVAKGIKKFISENWHEIERGFGKTPEARWRKVMLILLLAGIGTAAYTHWRAISADLSSRGDGHGNIPTPEGKGEPQHDDYEASALHSWQKYQNEGFLPGKMMDPMAIDNPETRLVTGYFPGWFCVPEQVATCEQIIGEKLNLPTGDTEKRVFFLDMQANWDKDWWPKVQVNPNLPQAVKDFYNPSNRVKLREWFRGQYPITPTAESSIMMRRNVADEMFLGFMASGKLMPNRPDILTYSHLLGGFVAAVYTAGAPILMPMTETGFIPEEGGANMQSGMLPGDVREAYRQIEVLGKNPESDLLTIAPYTKVVNDYQRLLEVRQDLKPGSLGRL